MCQGSPVTVAAFVLGQDPLAVVRMDQRLPEVRPCGLLGRVAEQLLVLRALVDHGAVGGARLGVEHRGDLLGQRPVALRSPGQPPLALRPPCWLWSGAVHATGTPPFLARQPRIRYREDLRASEPLCRLEPLRPAAQPNLLLLRLHADDGAVDLALWDLLGKRAGLPVLDLPGEAVRDRIKVDNTCPGPGYVRTSSRQVSENWGLAVVEAIREAAGFEMDLMVELHGLWNRPARPGSSRPYPHRPFWAEDPRPGRGRGARPAGRGRRAPGHRPVGSCNRRQ
jgi:hypothetical protein